MKTIAEQLESVYQAIHTCCDKYPPASPIRLLAVSKKHPAEAIHSAWQAGQREFGENYAQEGIDKMTQLAELKDIQWHFIGPLQSNKTRLVAEHYDWVQSLDRAKIARRLNEQRPANLAPLNVCLQINISGEASKSGVAPEQMMALAEQVSQLPHLRLRGLMSIGSNDTAKQHDEFTRMATLFKQLQHRFTLVDTLSMGMSGDWQQAIKSGATMIRLGTAIFGQRGN